MMNGLTRKQIQSATHKTAKVATPEWGDPGFVYVRQLPASSLATMTAVLESDDSMGALIQLAAMGICDEKGAILFTDASELDDCAIAPIKRCAEAILDINGLTDDSREELAKN